MNRTRLILTLVVTAMIASTLSFFYWDTIRDNIVVPVYFLLWVTDLFIKSIPQQVYLALLVSICFLMSVATLQQIQLRQIDPGRPRPRLSETTRYAHWRRIYRNLHGNPFFRNQFATETRKFLLAMLAYQEGLLIAQVEAQVIDGSLPVPPAVKYLIRQKEFDLLPQDMTPARTVGRRLWQMLGRSTPKFPEQPDAQVNQVIHFIEHRLEISHAGDQPGV